VRRAVVRIIGSHLELSEGQEHLRALPSRNLAIASKSARSDIKIARERKQDRHETRVGRRDYRNIKLH